MVAENQDARSLFCFHGVGMGSDMQGIKTTGIGLLTRASRGMLGGAAVAAAMLVGLSAANAGPNAVANGNFATTGGGAVATYAITTDNGVGSTAAGTLPSWLVTPGTVNKDCMVISAGFPTTTCTSAAIGAASPGAPIGGGNAASLEISSASGASISQTITLTAGSSYAFYFQEAAVDPATATGGGTDSYTVALTVTGGTTANLASITRTFTQGAAAGDNSGWNAYNGIFTAPTTAPYTFTIAATTSTAGRNPTVLVSNVQIPEPASIAVLGFGMAGLAGLRRRMAKRPI